MPKMVPCPVCKSDVKVPPSAAVGDVLTCPDCDEEFTPPHLKKKDHDPEAEEAYGVGGLDADEAEEQESTERREKKRKARAYQKAGREYMRDTRNKQPTPSIGGPEAVFLLIALAAGLAAFIGFIAAKRFPTIGEGALIILCYCGILGIFAWRRLVAR